MRRLSPWLLTLLLWSGCTGLDAIPATPSQTAVTWLTIQPCAAIRIASQEIILVQPGTTLFVYLLRVLDHVIVAKKEYYRFQEAG
jgi:hypothetical protein